MNHDNHHLPPSPEPADIAMQQVLRAEREAERSIAACEQEARDILKAAQQLAQRIAARTNQRISMLQLRHGQKLDRAIREIEQAGKQTEQAMNATSFDESLFSAVIDELAAKLTTGETDADTDRHT